MLLAITIQAITIWLHCRYHSAYCFQHLFLALVPDLLTELSILAFECVCRILDRGELCEDRLRIALRDPNAPLEILLVVVECGHSLVLLLAHL